MSVLVMGGMGSDPPGGEPPGRRSDDEHDFGEIYDLGSEEEEDEEQEQEEDEAEEVEEDDTDTGSEGSSPPVASLVESSAAEERKEDPTPLARPFSQPVTPDPKPRRKPVAGVVRQQDFAPNLNRVTGVQGSKKAGKKPSGNAKQAKDIARAKKGGVKFGEGQVELANQLGVKVPKVRPHTTKGTGQGGLGRHQERSGKVVAKVNQQMERKLQEKGKPKLSVLKAQQERKAKREEREDKKKKK